MIPRPTGGKARAETQACVPPAQTPISQLPALTRGPWTRSPVAPVWRRPQPPDLMLTVCEERPLTQKTDPPLSQAPPHQLLPSSLGKAGVGLQGKHRGVNIYLCLEPEPASHGRLPRCAGLPRAGHRRQGRGWRCSFSLRPSARRVSFPICKTAWLNRLIQGALFSRGM